MGSHHVLKRDQQLSYPKSIVSGVLFRVDVGPGIGLGHIHRNLGLAEALSQINIPSSFLVTNSESIASGVTRYGFSLENLGEIKAGTTEDAESVITTAASRNCSIVVVDSYAVGSAYISHLRSSGLLVVVIADEACQETNANVLVNGGAHALTLDYRSVSNDTKFFLGPKYALLRPEFWNCSPRSMSTSVRRLLLTVGGDDPWKLTERLVEWLAGRLNVDTRLDVVVGPFFTSEGVIRRAVEASPVNIRIITAPDHLHGLMMQCDLAVCCGGQTAYELAATGTPAVAMDIVKNQSLGVKALGRSGALIYGGCPSEDTLPDELDIAFVEAADQSCRQQLSSSGQALIDGRGAIRLAHEIANEF